MGSIGAELVGVPNEELPKNGVSQTALLIVANCAGAGILSLPKALNQAGLLAGPFLIVAAAVLSAYTADILGRCYSIIRQREMAGEFGAPPEERLGSCQGELRRVEEAATPAEPATSFFARRACICSTLSIRSMRVAFSAFISMQVRSAVFRLHSFSTEVDSTSCGSV